MKVVLHSDDAVGETRRCLADQAGRPFRLEIERWSERRQRARLGEIWWGRATARTPGGGGWFVDLGLEQGGLIETTKAASITEGALIPVRLKSEAWADKGARLSLADMPSSTSRPDKPALHAAAPEDEFLRGCDVFERVEGRTAREVIDAALEEALAIVALIPGGGDLAIEQTRALTAIDVDAGGRTGATDAQAFAREVNLAAAETAARQIALRSAGGLVVVDFLSMKAAGDRRAVAGAFRKALSSYLGRTSDVSEISGLGLCEASLARRARPVAEAAGTGPEREALDVLRGIESCGWSERSTRIRAKASQAAVSWLDADSIGWRAALAGRIGERWTIEAGQAGAPPQIWSE